MALMINPMRILELIWKVLGIISRICAISSAIGCICMHTYTYIWRTLWQRCRDREGFFAGRGAQDGTNVWHWGTHSNESLSVSVGFAQILSRVHCNTLQHTATHRNTHTSTPPLDSLTDWSGGTELICQMVKMYSTCSHSCNLIKHCLAQRIACSPSRHAAEQHPWRVNSAECALHVCVFVCVHACVRTHTGFC